MYKVYAERSPNVYKVTIGLAELGQDWEDVWVEVSRGAQHAPEFHAVNPNGRIPVLVDDSPADGGAPLTVWESGAILLYLAEKHGRLIPADPRGRAAVLTWLMWQMGSLGPMSGQNSHFTHYDIPDSAYARNRYRTETRRLYGVLNGQLAGHDWIAGDFSVADCACYPWVNRHEFQGMDIGEFPAIAAWLERMAQRPAVIEAYARMDKLPMSTATVAERFEVMRPEAGLAALGLR